MSRKVRWEVIAENMVASVTFWVYATKREKVIAAARMQLISDGRGDWVITSIKIDE